MPGSIIYDGNIFKLWYTGNNGSGWRIGYASSSNGLESWTKSSSPIMDIGSADGWEKGAGDPFVIFDDGIYKMWYTAVSDIWQYGPDRFRVGYATSDDGINWTKYSAWLLQGTQGAWDGGGMTRGVSVIKTSKGYEMWYAAVNEAMMGTDEERWSIGYALSPDGITWAKNPNPVISPTETWEQRYISYPNVVFDGTQYHMWYTATQLNLPIKIAYAVSSDGIHWSKPSDINPILSTGTSFDSVYICSPVILKFETNYRLYYSGYDGSRWRIGLAEGTLPGVGPQKLDPIIFLPGLGASWNHENIIFGIDKPQEKWYMTPGIKIYDGLFETLKNSGYETVGDNQNLFVFNYNWTQEVDRTTDELKTFIDNKIKSGEKINLIGHSLGGLTARVFAQKYPEYPINKIVSLGSPHQGVPHVYYTWEGGDFDQSLTGWPAEQRIGLGLIYLLRGKFYDTPSQTAHREFPVIQNLLPTFNYLKNNGVEVDVNIMHEKNNYLSNLNNQASQDLLTKFLPFSAVLNNPDNTLRWIEIKNPSWLDNLLSLWPDGKPTGIKSYYDGDNTVLFESASFAGVTGPSFDGLDHIDLVTNVEVQEKLLDLLNLPKSNIVPGKKISLPILVFQLASPAKLTITDEDGNVYENEENLIMIGAAKKGRYKINLTGIGSGDYSLYSGEIYDNRNVWNSFTGSINNGEIIELQLPFDPSSPNKPYLDQSGKAVLSSLNKKIDNLYTQILSLGLPTKTKKQLTQHKLALKLNISNNNFQNALVILNNSNLEVLRILLNNTSEGNTLILLRSQFREISQDMEQIYLFNSEGKKMSPKSLTAQRSYAGYLQIMCEKRIKLLTTNAYKQRSLANDYLLALQELAEADTSSKPQEKHINIFQSNLTMFNIISLK